jgi:hypothetical protein
LWLSGSKKELSPKLEGSLEGTERQEWWDYQMQFLIVREDNEAAAGEGKEASKEDT